MSTDDDLFPATDADPAGFAPPRRLDVPTPPTPDLDPASAPPDEQASEPDFGTGDVTTAPELQTKESAPSGSKASRRQRRGGGDSDDQGGAAKAASEMASLVLRVARKLELARNADPDALAALAAPLGVRADDIPAIVAACMSSSQRVRAMNDTLDLRSADPLSLGIELLTRGRERMLAIWRVLGSLQLVDGAMHPSDARAALVIAQTVTQKMADHHAETLRLGIDLAGELAKK